MWLYVYVCMCALIAKQIYYELGNNNNGKQIINQHNNKADEIVNHRTYAYTRAYAHMSAYIQMWTHTYTYKNNKTHTSKRVHKMLPTKT